MEKREGMGDPPVPSEIDFLSHKGGKSLDIGDFRTDDGSGCITELFLFVGSFDSGSGVNGITEQAVRQVVQKGPTPLQRGNPSAWGNGVYPILRHAPLLMGLFLVISVSLL